MNLIFGIEGSLTTSSFFDSFLFDKFFLAGSAFYLPLYLTSLLILHSLLSFVADCLRLRYCYLNFKIIKDQKKTFYCGLFRFQLNSFKSTKHPPF